MFKSRVQIDSFSGKTALSVKQDILAKVFMMSLCAAFAFPIEEKAKAEYNENNGYKHPQKINRTTAYANLKDIAVGLFIHKKTKKAIQAFDLIVYNTREIVRPGRRNPRNHKPKKKYYLNYKDL